MEDRLTHFLASSSPGENPGSSSFFTAPSPDLNPTFYHLQSGLRWLVGNIGPGAVENISELPFSQPFVSLNYKVALAIIHDVSDWVGTNRRSEDGS
jgi:hypothetical protein